MANWAILGDYDSILPFGALGLTLYPAENAAQGNKALRRIQKTDCAVLCITEALAAEMEESLEKLYQQAVPAVVLIPGQEGNTGQGKTQMAQHIQRAVGASLWEGGEK